MEDAHTPGTGVVLIAGSKLALAHGVAGRGGIDAFMQEAVGTVDVGRQGIAVTGRRTHAVDTHSGGAQFHGHRAVGIGLGEEQLAQDDRFRIRIKMQGALPGELVGCAVGKEENRLERIFIPVLADGDGAGLDLAPVHGGLSKDEIAVLRIRLLGLRIGVGRQVILVADERGLEGRAALGQGQFKIALAFHFGSIAGPVGEFDLVRSREHAGKRIQDRLVAGGKSKDHAGHQKYTLFHNDFDF